MKKIIIILCCLVVSYISIYAENMQESELQKETISGKVIDEDGDPVLAASVYITGKDIETCVFTDKDGGFTISTEDQVAYLTVAYIGYPPNIVHASNASLIKLEPNPEMLNTVVRYSSNDTLPKLAKKLQPITGKVVDEDGNPVLAASVYKSSEDIKKGVFTDEDGFFSISTDNTDVYIIVSYIGYPPIAVQAKNATMIKLKPDPESLNTIFITGDDVK